MTLQLLLETGAKLPHCQTLLKTQHKLSEFAQKFPNQPYYEINAMQRSKTLIGLTLFYAIYRNKKGKFTIQLISSQTKMHTLGP